MTFFVVVVTADLKSGLGNVYPLISNFLNNEPNVNFYDNLVDPTYDMFGGAVDDELNSVVFPHTASVQDLLDEISAIYKPLQKEGGAKVRAKKPDFKFKKSAPEF